MCVCVWECVDYPKTSIVVKVTEINISNKLRSWKFESYQFGLKKVFCQTINVNKLCNNDSNKALKHKLCFHFLMVFVLSSLCSVTLCNSKTIKIIDYHYFGIPVMNIGI